MKPSVVLGSAFTVVVLLSGAFQVMFFGVPLLGDKQTQHETYTQQITKLVFDGESSDVSIRGGSDEVEVTRKLRWHSGKPRYSETWAGGVLTIRPLDCDGVGVCDLDYEIAVPADTELDIRTSSGDVETSLMSGHQVVIASSGDVDIEQSGGPVSVETSSGDTSVDSETQADIDVLASSGDIEICLPGGDYDASADADSGDVNVEVETDNDSPFKVSASASSGDIEITYR